MSTVPIARPYDRVYEILTGDDVDRVCLDIPEERCREQPRNFLLQVSALSATKTAEGIGIDADSAIVPPALVFLATIADQGAKLGRSTHVVDMAAAAHRAAYTALTNTIGGVALLGAGLFGFVGQRFGASTVLLLLAAMCVVAMRLASGLDEVQQVVGNVGLDEPGGIP